MYCVKCGVELSNSEKKCPLCNTPVYYPDLPTSEENYPKAEKVSEEIAGRAVIFIITFILTIALIVTFASDLRTNGRVVWSGYAMGGILLGYLFFIMPLWFKKPSPAIFIPCDLFGVLLYLWYIDFWTGGGWFFPFAFPIAGCVGIIVITVAVLTYYLKRGYFYIFGGCLIAFSGFFILLEWLIYVNFSSTGKLFIWSIYPAIALFLLGIMLIIIGVVKPFQRYLKKIFAI